MNDTLFVANLTAPTLLFFVLGIVAQALKSDLEIPESSSRFISFYLLFSIGFKGGVELNHAHFSFEIIQSILFGLTIASIIPIYSFFILRKKMGVANAGAIAASYGSVSAVTFVAAVTFLENLNLVSDGYMVAVMAMMESPAIIMGVVLIRYFGEQKSNVHIKTIVRHSLTNGSVIMILGSLLVGVLSDPKQAETIKPFTSDIFKGFLAIFLLEMGMLTAKRFGSFLKSGWFPIAFAVFIPLVNGVTVAFLSQYVTDHIANRFIFAVLAASASYIAVPAAMRLAAPDSNPGIYLPMALGITFPLNISLGMPLFWKICQIKLL